MKFTFYNNDLPDGARRVVGSAFGYANHDVGPDKVPGFLVELANDQADLGWVDFTIPELRQMLAEAQELAEKDQLANCDCANCDCQTYAPLATEQELIEEAQDNRVQGILDEIDAERRRNGVVVQEAAELQEIAANLISIANRLG